MVMTEFEKFRASLINLHYATSNSEVAYHFIMTFEAACAVIRQGLALPGLDPDDKRAIIQKAYERNLIQNPAWLKMLRISSKLKEDYTGEVIAETIDTVRGQYTRCFHELRNKLESKQINTMNLFSRQVSYKEYCIGNGGPIVEVGIDEFPDDFVDTGSLDKCGYATSWKVIILLKALKMLVKNDIMLKKFVELNPIADLHSTYGSFNLCIPYTADDGVAIHNVPIKIYEATSLISSMAKDSNIDLDFTVWVKDGSGPKYDSLVQACIELKDGDYRTPIKL